MRRLLNIGVVFALVLSCSGRALAVTPCPHGCHASAAARTHRGSRRGGGQPADHCHSAAAGGEAQQAAGTSGYESPDDAGLTGAGAKGPEATGVLNSVRAFCDHCVGRAELPSSSLGEQEADQSGRGERAAAPAVAARSAHASTAFVKEIIPYEDGPPPAVHRHVLISVFRV